MLYFITFLEGVISFISPCLLPLLPVYVSYFAGGGVASASGGADAGGGRDGAAGGRVAAAGGGAFAAGGRVAAAGGRAGAAGGRVAAAGRRRAAANATGFIIGFSAVFTALGAFAGVFGSFFIAHRTAVNIITGAVVVAFGINYTGLVNIPFLNRTRKGSGAKITGFFSSALFGVVFSAGWTPCVGAFLGSALMLASTRASAAQGTVMLLCYSLGLGLPFFISALLIGELKSAFDFIKKHYKFINMASGLFLIIVGILMMTGFMGRVISFLSFV